MIVLYDSIINDIDCYKYFCSNKGACDILLMNHLMHLQVLFSGENGQCQKTFYPFCGVNEELKMFIQDMLAASKVLLLANQFQINFYYLIAPRSIYWNNLAFPFWKKSQYMI